MTKANATPALAAATTVIGLALASGLNPALAHAECRDVCITDLRTQGSHVHVEWTGNPRFDSYQVYWEVGQYIEVQSRSVGPAQFTFDIPDAKRGELYKVSVMGCTPYIPLFATSRCGSNVDQRTITA